MRKITFLLLFAVCAVFAQAQTTLFSENFDKVTTTAAADPNGNVASSRDLAAIAKIDSALQSTTGWTGTKVYLSSGKLKMGTSSVMGNLTTPSIDLSSKSFTVSADLASWVNTGGGTDTGSSIDIQIDGVVVATLTYTTAMLNYTTPTITVGTASSKITFAAKLAKNRFFIDNIKVATVNTGISNPTNKAFSAVVKDGKLVLSNVADGSKVDIFSAMGSKVQSSVIANGEVSLNLPTGMYIVRTGNATQKFMLK